MYNAERTEKNYKFGSHKTLSPLPANLYQLTEALNLTDLSVIILIESSLWSAHWRYIKMDEAPGYKKEDNYLHSMIWSAGTAKNGCKKTKDDCL